MIFINRWREKCHKINWSESFEWCLVIGKRVDEWEGKKIMDELRKKLDCVINMEKQFVENEEKCSSPDWTLMPSKLLQRHEKRRRWRDKMGRFSI